MKTIITSTPLKIGFGLPKSILPRNHWPHIHLLKPSNSINTKRHAIITCNKATIATKTVYKDNWLDKIAINYMSQTLQEISGSFCYSFFYNICLYCIYYLHDISNHRDEK